MPASLQLLQSHLISLEFGIAMALIVDEEGADLFILRADEGVNDGSLCLRVRCLDTLDFNHLHRIVK